MLSVFIKAVNFIKSHTLQLCEENNKDFQILLLHIEVRWLSKENCLQHFVTLWDTIISFMSDKEHNEQHVDMFYLADVFQKLNLLNKN